ncbi:hypothetical protein C8J57DRAFT_1722922 [Mycena rebaudengoi]|nr:hypothetical protein C8J57DRAFT_1722922 [Mycena rebaudengoi]
MSTAQDEVISTAELLELILAQLPLNILLATVPLVSKTWQSATLSPTLQRALFFQPDPYQQVRKASAIATMPWANAPAAFKRPEASWRRMHPSQPPAQTMVIVWIIQGRPMMGTEQRRAVLNRDAPLRMGFLYDVTVARICGGEMGFRINWQNNSKDTDKGDVRLEVFSRVMCVIIPALRLDEKFHSDGAEPVEIKFESWGGPRTWIVDSAIPGRRLSQTQAAKVRLLRHSYARGVPSHAPEYSRRTWPNHQRTRGRIGRIGKDPVVYVPDALLGLYVAMSNASRAAFDARAVADAQPEICAEVNTLLHHDDVHDARLGLRLGDAQVHIDVTHRSL